MKIFSSTIIILLFNTFCTFSQIPHDIVYLVGCFENGTTEAQYEFDAEEVLYVNFTRQDIVYTVPKFLILDPSEMFENMHFYKNAVKNKKICSIIVDYLSMEEKHIPEEKDPPESILYPSEDVQPDVENSLVCFVNNFYPPYIKVSWTKNGQPVSEGVSLSRYYPNKDQTFHQFSTLTFTPKEGDIYSCSVEHSALESPTTRIWEPDMTSHPSLALDVYCGVGLTLGLLGVATGVFLIVKGHIMQSSIFSV